MKTSILQKTPLALAIFAVLNTPSVSADTLEKVTVKSDFREADIQQSTTSVTVIDETEIKKNAARGLDDLIGRTPNVNASSGASNANYFQIRGMGERSQFSTPINPSVGVMVDDFDYSRMGAGATMFDVEQVEVLRGPQGTKFGSSALAGVINIKTNEASKETKAKIEATVGSFNTKALGVAVGGTLIENKLLGRIAVHKHSSDGYMENTHLNRKDTQNEDELTARANLKFLVNDDLNFDLKILHLNIDNGYDAFNFKNGYQTISDDPGHDKLKSDAVALTANYKLTNKVNMKATLTKTDADSEYGYDVDWAHDNYTIPANWPYSYTDNYKRKRKNASVELRLMSSETGRIFDNSTDWVAGVYGIKQDERLDRVYNKKSSSTIEYSSYDYNTVNNSLYGQLDHQVNDKMTISFGLRAELFNVNFKTSSGFNDTTEEFLVGGKIAATHQINKEHLGFVTLSKGYKTGGVNDATSLSSDQLTFDSETIYNLEAGVNSSMLNGKLQTRLNAFYAVRKNMQISSYYENTTDNDFYIYMDNVDEGKNLGLEAQVDWLVIPKFKLLTSLGLLKTSVTKYTYSHGKYDTDNKLDGRNQAHAPTYQYSIGGEFYATDNLTLSANIEGKDAFYFSTSHNEKSTPYKLLNASAEYVYDNFTFTAWARNITDTEYDTRGFYFGNNPADGYTPTQYNQKGEPRTLGVTVSYDY